MRWTLKELLKNCRAALKKAGTKREKWLKEWAGQVGFTFLINLLIWFNLLYYLFYVFGEHPNNTTKLLTNQANSLTKMTDAENSDSDIA